MKYDMHVHTYLSDCASRDAFADGYIKLAEEYGQSILGFADHAWAEGVPGVSEWYKPQTFSRLVKQKEELHAKSSSVKLLQGAEGEYANFLLGIDEDAAAIADYILIPHDHIHMSGFVVPVGYEPPAKMACFLLDSFEAICKHPKRNLITALCHPLIPCCKPTSYVNEVLKEITDAQMEEALTAAKETDMMLELNTSCFAKLQTEEDFKSYEYIRFVALAKEKGNVLYWGSDAHSHERYRYLHDIAPKILSYTGLTEEDFTEAERRMLQL